jgi:hypothetical protein
VVAAVLTIGIMRRIVDGEERAGRLPLLLLAGVSFASMSTNPLYAVWAAAPSGGVLLLLALADRAAVRAALATVVALAAGSTAGLLLHELVLARWIMAERGDYLRPELIAHAIGYYGDFLAGLPANPGGPVWLAALVILWALTGWLAFRGWRRRDAGTALVALTSIAAAFATATATILSGSEALRYLQPMVFLPVLSVALLPVRSSGAEGAGVPWLARRETPRDASATPGEAVGIPSGRGTPARPSRPVGGVLGGALVALAAVAVTAAAVPSLVRASTATDADVDCVTGWIEETEASGVGDFWTIRAPKAYLDDPSPLIQITHDFIVWPWLTNRTDYAGADATFVLIDHDSPELIYPQGFSSEQARTVSCGRYTILDFGERVLPLGP